MIRYFWSTLRCFNTVFINVKECGSFVLSLRIFSFSMLTINRTFGNLQAVWSQPRNKKILLVVLVIFVLLLYLWPSHPTLQLFPAASNNEILQQCTKTLLREYKDVLSQADAVAFHAPLQPGEQAVFPYVGNGKLGVSSSSGSAFYIRRNRTLDIALRYFPVAELNLSRLPKRSVTVVHFLHGLVLRRDCFEVSPESYVAVSYRIFAHRTRPSILVQDINVDNLSGLPVILTTSYVRASGWKGAVTSATLVNKQDFSLTRGTVRHNTSCVIEVLVASPVLEPQIDVKPHGSFSGRRLLTAVHYSAPLKDEKSVLDHASSQLQERLLADLSAAVLVPAQSLLTEHTSAWSTLWQTGFSISHSHAPGFLNGARINSSMYWCMSQSRAPLHEHELSASKRHQLLQVLNYAEKCFNGHRTITNSETDLWRREVTGEAALNALVLRWFMLLVKQGCSSMLTAGADGVAQAMTLTFGPLRFSQEHLELAVKPVDLHRDHHFRRIQYGKDTHVNISVEVGADNKAKIYVSLDRNDRPYYACDAGCLDPPVKLDKQRRMFPVKQTKPESSILYITADEKHIKDLKHAFAFDSHVVEAPAHGDHILQMHRHGHRWGGLPLLFWVLLVLLVVCFHVLLCRLIYKDYCVEATPAEYGRRYIA